jgi:hypothetical protein
MLHSEHSVVLLNILDSGYDIGLSAYPIFDEEYRIILNEKIKDHYAIYEIGYDTPELFKRRLNVKMNEVMPFFNQLYKSTLLSFNPLFSIDLSETNTKNTNGTSTTVADATDTSHNKTDITSHTHDVNSSKNDGTNSATTDTTDTINNKNLSVHSDTPSHLLSIDDLNEDSYADGVDRTNGTTTNCSNVQTDGITSSKIDGTADVTGTSESISDGNGSNHGVNTGTIVNLEEYTNRKFGNVGAQNYSQLLNDFRSTFLNIDMQVIESLKTCFMGVW